MSSLRDQLSQIAQKSQGVAVDRKRRSKIHSASLIYNPKIASTQDYEFLFETASTALEELISIDPRFQVFTKSLFNESAISMDRNTITNEELKDLNTTINLFLMLINSKWNLTPTLHAAEWLVRRFQIHIHNADYLLFSSLQYYQLPVFKRILNIIKLPPLWTPLANFVKTDSQSPSNLSIIKLFQDFEFLTEFEKFLNSCIKKNFANSKLLCFTTCSLINLVPITTGKNENLIISKIIEIVAKLLMANNSSSNDCQISAHTILIVLSKKELDSKIIMAAIETLLSNLQSSVHKSAFIAMASLCQSLKGSISVEQFSIKLYKLITSKFGSEINTLIASYGANFDKFSTSYIRSIVRFDHDRFKDILPILSKLEIFERKIIIMDLIHLSEIIEDKSKLIPLFEKLIKNSDEELILSCLDTLNLSGEIFEIRLTTSLFTVNDNNSDIEKIVKDVESSKIVGGMTDIIPFKEWLSKNAQFCFTSNESILAAKDEDFNKLLSLFVEALGKKYSTGLFLNSFLSTIEARVTFLLRIVVSPAAPIALRLVALSHLSKMLNSIDKDLNLFTLVPVLVTGLFDVSRNVRLSIKKVLHQILKKSDVKNSNFFLVKGIYGKLENGKTTDLSSMMMSPEDSYNWLSKFLEIYNIDNYDLSRSIIQKKTEKVDLMFWCYQVRFIPLIYSKNCLLKTITNYKNYSSTYSQLLEPVLETYLENRTTLNKVCVDNKCNFAEFETNVVNIISIKEKNEACIEFIIKALKVDSEQLTEIVSNKLIAIYPNLKPHYQLKIVNEIVESTSSSLIANSNSASSSLAYDSLSVLQSLNIHSDIFVSILDKNRINSDDNSDQMLKRRRRRRSSAAAKSALQKDEVSHLAEVHLSKITIILETLDSNKNIQGTEELLTSLFNHLSDLEILEQDGGFPVLYVQETLSSCMLNVIESLKKSNKKLNYIRSDIVVSAIRSSPSPQVQNKLLLVIGALATLNPEMILHSVMPIFTFMGAHTIRQDDEFSTHVVENTIKAVVPALLSSSESRNNEVEFLLSTFAAAFPHVPKHRRVKLFTTLVSTLGSNKAISPFLFLIGEQYSNSINKFKISEGKDFVEFAKNFLNKFNAVDQLQGILGIFKLVELLPTSNNDNEEELKEKLMKKALFSNNIVNLNLYELNKLKKSILHFVNKLVIENSNDYYSNGSLKLRVLASLLDKKEDHTLIKSLFTSLNKIILESIEVVNAQILTVSKTSSKTNSLTSDESEFELRDIVTDTKQILFDLLSNVLYLLPITEFIESVLPLLTKKYEDPIRQHITLSIGERFQFEPMESYPVAMQIIDVMFENIKDVDSNTDITQASLSVINSLVSKFKENIDSQMLTEALSTACDNLKSEHIHINIASLAVITNCIQVLGVKSISYYPKTVPAALKLFKKYDGKTVLKNELQLSIVLLFATVIKKIPMFVVSNLQDILVTIFYSSDVAEEIRLSVLKLVVENIDLKEVLKTLYKIWQSGIFNETEKPSNDISIALSLFLSILETTVEKIDKKSATTQSPTFFKLLLALFEYRSYSKFDNNTIGRIEATVHKIANIYVLKLNDKVFRPLFALVVRWAFDGEGVTHVDMTRDERLIAFFKFFNKLQEHLRSIITTYFTYLLDNTHKLLLAFIEGTNNNINLRRLVLIAIGSSFKNDRDEYWRSTARFELVVESLVNQLSNIEPTIGKYLVKAIGALAYCNNGSEEHNKIMNKLLISHMKSGCKSNEKLWAVRSVKLIYTKVGESWLSLLPQLVPIVAELLEDDDEQVEYEVRTGLVKVFENVLGEPFDRYLD